MTKLPNNKKTTAKTIAPLHGIGDWHANLLTIQRRQCVLFVHDITRYAVFIPCLTKPDFANLDLHFQDVFINSLMKAGVSMDLVDKATRFLMPEYTDYDTECNRSVQGTMRLMADDISWGLQYDNESINDLLPYSTSAKLSDRSCRIKGQKDCIWPIKAMIELLTNIPELQLPPEGLH